MGDREITQEVKTERGHAQSSMGRYRHVEFLSFSPQRIKSPTTIEPSSGRHCREDRAHHPKLVDRPPQFFNGLRDILNGQQRDADEPWTYRHEFVIEPIIVRAGHTDGPVLVLNGRVGQTLSWIENGKFNPILVEEIQPIL